MTGQVVESARDGVLVLELDNPPVNASSQQVRSGVLAGVERLTVDPALVAAVLVGANGSFVAGSDIGEFGGDIPEPLLPEVIAAIEQCPKPVIAALEGVALGGGLELALGCDARIATADVRIGLPEVTLGMVPGAGGTQRLSRLVGRARALELILSGRRIAGTEAKRLGIVDQLVDEDLRTAAVSFALTAEKRRLTDLAVADDGADLDEIAAQSVRGTRRPNMDAAADLVRSAGIVDVTEALRNERDAFDRLRISDDARALRHLFRAERAAPRRAEVMPSQDPLSLVGVIGAGAMGAGIGAAFALAGVGVRLMDTDPRQIEHGLTQIRKTIQKAVRRGLLDEEGAAVRLARVAGGELADISDADLVIEAVVERSDVKSAVLRAAAAQTPHAVLATNTSYLSVTDLAAALDAPDRLLGIHFFNPADVMKLIEITPGEHTSEKSLAVALRAARTLGKTAVITGDREGFIGNRVYTAYRRHAEYLLEDGAMPDQVDAAMEEFGFAMGPFAVADLSGLQIAQSLRQRWRDTGRLPARYVEIPDLLCARGWLGQRSDRGYHRYEHGRRVADTEVQELIVAESARKGIRRRAIDTDEIVSRLVGAMVVEGARVVHEGTARHVDDVDVAMVNGFGFPRFAGGPMHWARSQDPAAWPKLVEMVTIAAREESKTTSITEVLDHG